MITLSKRLQAAADFVPAGAVLVDVGTDHAYLPLYLVQNGKIPRAVAADVREGPLQRAREHIDEAGLSDRIKTRLSDGLRNITVDDGDALAIAGMGGMLLLRILREGETDHFKTMILAPQSDPEAVRRGLMEMDIRIIKENFVYDGGKYYPVLQAVHGTDPDEDPVRLCYGKHLMPQAFETLRDYLSAERKTLTRALCQIETHAGGGAAARKRMEELKDRIHLNAEAVRRIETERTWNSVSISE